jgi:DNA polymerase V
MVWYDGGMIGLLDCNNFFVSCERLFRPDLLKRPVAVLSSNDGCIVARSAEVKDLGVPMGVPYFQVKDVLTKAGAVLFSSNFTLYRDVSARVMDTLQDEVGLIDVYSIDEAFFEVEDDATEADVLAIRARVMKEVGVPVSIGIAATKTLAKQASVLAKKGNGVCILTDALWQEKMKEAPCGSVWGLGRQTVIKLREMGVTTVAQYLRLPLPILRQHFGVVGERIQNELKGLRVYELGEGETENVQQSIMSTRSFEKTTNELSALESALGYHVSEVAEKLREKKLLATTMTVMILPSRHSDFFMRRGSVTMSLPRPTNETSAILHEALLGLRQVYDHEVPYKKAGVLLGGLLPLHVNTGSLFDVGAKDTHILDEITDSVNAKFGHGTLRSGVVLTSGARGSAKLRSKEYTTNWKDIPTVHAM